MKKRLLLGSTATLIALMPTMQASAQTPRVPADVAAPSQDAQTGNAPNAVPSDTTPAAQDSQTTGSAAGADIVVTGIRRSLAEAASIKRNSDQVVDSIVAQDIGKFPDPTVAAALQRVPGVQVVVGDNNEISNPIIRGLGDILTTLNGREVFTGAGRGFSFQDLPAEALAGADVYKSNSANLLEGGVAGVIDLKLHRPFDFKGLTIAGAVRNSYSTNLHESNPTVNALISDRFDTGIGEIGILVNASFSDTKFDRPVAFDDLMRSGNHGPPGAAGALIPTGTGGLNQFGEYKRPEVNIALQWQASPDLQFYADGIYDGYRNRSSTAFLINDAFSGSQITNLVLDNNCNNYAVNGAGFNDPKGTVERLCNTKSFTSTNAVGFTSNQAHDQRTDDYIAGGGFKYNHDRFHVNADISYQKSTYFSHNFIIDVGKQLPQLDVTTNVDGGVNFTAVGNPLGQEAGFAFTNGLDDDRSVSKGTLFAAQVDGTYDVGGLLKNIQVGGRIADRKGSFQQVIVNPAAPIGPYKTPVAGQGLPSDFFQAAPGVPRIYGGDAFLIPRTDSLLNPAVQDQLRTLFNVPTGDQPYDPTRSFYASEKTYAGYVQGKYEMLISGPIKIDGLVGVRFTKTDRTISGTGTIITPTPTAAQPNLTTAVLNPVTRSTSDTNWLPNASARLSFGGGLQARASYAKVLSRPDFGSLNPGLNYALSTNANIQAGGSAGNPDLTPQKADEYDATLEYYFGRSNYFSIGVYKKNITGRIITEADSEVIGGQPYQISRPRNLGSAELKGIEASGQYFFDFLPGPLSGLGAFANYTIADSKVTAKEDTLYGEPLIGVSKYNYNVGLIFEKYGISTRAVYSHRSHYFDGDLTSSVNVRPVDQGTFLNGVRPSGRLDFSVNYDVNKHLTLTVDGTNVTKARYESYYGNTLNPHDIRFDDTNYSIGARVRF